MDFLDIENYENLIQIHKLNKEIHLLKLEINEFNDKKKSNIYFLNLQQELFNSAVQKKINLLKKYNYRIIKNILNMHTLQKKNNELQEGIQNNSELIMNYNNNLLYYSIDKFNTKKSIEKILIKYNNIIQSNNEYKIDLNKILNSSSNDFKYKILKNLDNINLSINNGLNNYYIFQRYINKYNLNNDIDLIIKYHYQIYKQYILKYKLNIEYKEYLKYKVNSIVYYKLKNYKILIIKII